MEYMTFVWTLQGVTPTVIDLTDVLQFAGATFDSPVFINEYNESTHVRASGGADDSSGNTPNNNKFISQAGGTAGDSEVDIGAGTVDIDSLADGDASLKINVSDGASIIVEDIVFYSYDGVTTTDPLAGLDVRAAEVGDANFTECEGSAAALAIANSSTPATSHDFFIIISKSPTTFGLKSDVLRFEAVVS